MNTEPNYLNILRTLAKWGTAGNLVHTEWSEYHSASRAMVTICSELGEDTGACYLSDCDIECEDEDELRKKYGIDDGDDERDMLVERWYCECEEYNREQIDRILDRFGIMEGWKIHVPEDTEIIVRKPSAEHITSQVCVYQADEHDEEEAEEDHDNTYTKTTVFDAVQDAVKEIIAIDLKGVGSRTPTDLWRRRLAVEVLQEVESL